MQNGMINNILSMMGYTPAKLAQEYCARYGGDVSTLQNAIERGDKAALEGLRQTAAAVAKANPHLLEKVKARFFGVE